MKFELVLDCADGRIWHSFGDFGQWLFSIHSVVALGEDFFQAYARDRYIGTFESMAEAVAACEAYVWPQAKAS